MEVKTYPSDTLEQVVDSLGGFCPHVRLMSAKVTDMGTNWIAAISRMEAIAAQVDGVDRETVDIISLGSMLIVCSSAAAASAAVAGKKFSPYEFGRFAERVAIEMEAAVASYKAQPATQME